MYPDPRLLVVDDEQVICQACRRVFTRQGFTVEECSCAEEGLRWARERDYAAILLDIKMPTMDGLEFLAELRKSKPDVPVILMTGYPSIPNAASAVRLGASDYVTKPFTPEEITQAVQRMLSPASLLKQTQGASPDWVPANAEVRFLDEAWCRLGTDGAARVGVMLTCGCDENLQTIRLPGIGEVVYRGLPLASVTIEGKPERAIASPLSGVVVAVNEELKKSTTVLTSDPCGAGWVAAIAPTRLEDDAARTTLRTVLLLNADQASAESQGKELARLGCVVRAASSFEGLVPLLRDPEASAVLVDATSLGAQGLEVVRRLKGFAPSKKIVVFTSREADNEAAYRELGIFYFAVEPFADNEIVQILEGLFRPVTAKKVASDRSKQPSEPVGSISTTNRNGKKCCLLVNNGLLRVDEGLGGLVRQKLLDMRLSLETILGSRPINSVRIADATSKFDHVVLLTTKDVGRVPGSLVRDAKGEFITVAGETAEKVTSLVVQPVTSDGSIEGMDPRIIASLAEHIAVELATC
ncbi:MAG: response regulator [Planctomycetota bacterium]